MLFLLMLASLVTLASTIPLIENSDSSSISNISSTYSVNVDLPIPTKYTLPSDDVDLLTRKQEIKVKQKDILYGPSIIGETSFFPSGGLGDQISQRDQGQWVKDSEFVVQSALSESAAALEDIQKVLDACNLQLEEVLIWLTLWPKAWWTPRSRRLQNPV